MLSNTAPADVMAVRVRRNEVVVDVQVRLLSYAEVRNAMTAYQKQDQE